MKALAAIALIATLAGCETPPAVNGFNGHSVTVQKMGYDMDPADAQAEADRVCGSVGKSAKFESSTLAAKGLVAPVRDFFYLCV